MNKISTIEELENEDSMYEQSVQAAILGSRQSFRITAKMAVDTPFEREVFLDFRWPSLDDQAEIGNRAASYYQVPLNALSMTDQNIAQARAVIETLAVGPFPEWLPPSDNPVKIGGRIELRPDTGKCKSMLAPLAIYMKYVEVLNRFQRLVI